MTSPAWFQIDGFQDPPRGISPVDIRCGTGRIGELGSYLDQRGLRRALIVAGTHVGVNPAVMDPLREALGTRLVEVFAGTTPDKRADSVFEGIRRMRAASADVIIGVGGGASLVIARQISTLADDGRSLEAVRDEVRATGRLRARIGQSPVPVVVVPTTLAGADLSAGGTFQLLSADDAPDGRAVSVNPGGVAPIAAFYDPGLFHSTPPAALAGSAINGLNKGIESIYAPGASHFSDAVAQHGLVLMAGGLLELSGDRRSGLERAVSGAVLVQLKRDISVLHAFGQVLSRRFAAQQGLVHAAVTVPVLSLVFSRVPARRDLLAAAFRSAGASTAIDDAEATIDGVTAIRDRLELPSRLSALGDPDAVDLRGCAEEIHRDPLTRRGPIEPVPTVDEIHDTLLSAC